MQNLCDGEILTDVIMSSVIREQYPVWFSSVKIDHYPSVVFVQVAMSGCTTCLVPDCPASAWPLASRLWARTFRDAPISWLLKARLFKK